MGALPYAYQNTCQVEFKLILTVLGLMQIKKKIIIINDVVLCCVAL